MAPKLIINDLTEDRIIVTCSISGIQYLGELDLSNSVSVSIHEQKIRLRELLFEIKYNNYDDYSIDIKKCELVINYKIYGNKCKCIMSLNKLSNMETKTKIPILPEFSLKYFTKRYHTGWLYIRLYLNKHIYNIYTGRIHSHLCDLTMVKSLINNINKGKHLDYQLSNKNCTTEILTINYQLLNKPQSLTLEFSSEDDIKTDDQEDYDCIIC